VETRVRGDAIQPRPKRRGIGERVLRAPRADQGLLQGVLAVVRRAEHAVAVHAERIAVGLDELEERRVDNVGHGASLAWRPWRRRVRASRYRAIASAQATRRPAGTAWCRARP